jgi:hypothetical protein
MSFKDLASNDSLAEQARQANESLSEALRAKRVRYVDGRLEAWPDGPKYAVPVQGEFSPQTAGLAVAHDGILLKGGPFDDCEAKIPRGAALYERPTAGIRPDDPPFVPARYKRTSRRDADSGLTVFQYQELEVAASA